MFFRNISASSSVSDPTNHGRTRSINFKGIIHKLSYTSSRCLWRLKCFRASGRTYRCEILPTLKTDQRADWHRNFLCKWNTLLQQNLSGTKLGSFLKVVTRLLNKITDRKLRACPLPNQPVP